MTNICQNGQRPGHENRQPLLYHYPRLFHHLRHLSTSCYTRHTESWTEEFHFHNRSPLGGYHDRLRLRVYMDGADPLEDALGCLGGIIIGFPIRCRQRLTYLAGRLFSWDCIPSEHMVCAM